MEQKLLRVAVSPHIHSPVTTQRIMLDVLIALAPAAIFSVWLYGVSALWMLFVAVASSVGFEWISRRVMKRKQTISDLSAAVTGVLLAFCLPANTPLYMVVVGAFIAIVVAKQFFGGIGMNFVNPALIGRIALSVSFAKEISAVPALTERASNLASQFVGDAVSSATYAVSTASPMQLMNSLVANKEADIVGSIGMVDWKGAFLGLHTGSLGEVSVLCILLGFIYLLVRGVIKPYITCTYLAAVFCLTYLYSGSLEFTAMAMFSGGLFLGAVFMATDYTTSPVTPKGQVIFAMGCGILTATIRYFGAMPEATAYSIILMNLLVPYINQISRPVPFGDLSPRAKAKNAQTSAAK